ncbi:hypothetical protein GLOIN_2v1683002, partial [Rhizophagus irregularis DAOM 181602=DAOM 197198]
MSYHIYLLYYIYFLISYSSLYLFILYMGVNFNLVNCDLTFILKTCSLFYNVLLIGFVSS